MAKSTNAAGFANAGMLSIRAPPGLESPELASLAPPPGLESCGALPPQVARFPPASAALCIEQDPVLRAYCEYLQRRNECKQKKPAFSANACFEGFEGNATCAAAACKPPGVFCAPLFGIDMLCSNSTSPAKPPGVFQRVGSTHSLASTAATATDEKMEEFKPTMQPHRTETIRELRVEHFYDGSLKVQWPVDAKKLRSKDQQIISSSFEAFPGCSFKLMMKPKSAGDRKGQTSFQKAKGTGSVELKLMDRVAEAPRLRFRISVGAQEQPRGPVEHDFSESTVGSLAPGDDKFDFASAVEPNSSSFVVTLEVLP